MKKRSEINQSNDKIDAKKLKKSPIDEKNKNDKPSQIEQLPICLLTKIISYAGHNMICALMLVNKRWQKATNSKLFWESMLMDYSKTMIERFEIPLKNYLLIPPFFKDRTYKELFEMKRVIKTDTPEKIEKEEPIKRLGTKIINKVGFFEGEMLGSKQHGVGVLYKLKLGIVFQGDFLNGKITGKGKRIWPNGDVYEGEFLDSKRNGMGTLKLVGTGEYKGQFENDKREGKGEMIFENGDVYNGSWKNDMANGLGSFTSKSGYEYEGNWVDNHKQGFGKLTYQRGVYEGEWKDNKAHGKGKIMFKNGTSYVGSMHENAWHGEGIFTWNDGRRYVGEFVNSKQQGSGKIYSADGSLCYDGQFRNNRPHGEGTLYLKSGYRYIGQMKNGLKEGTGKIYDSSNRLCMSGEFNQGNFAKGTVYKHYLQQINSSSSEIILDNSTQSSNSSSSISFNDHDNLNSTTIKDSCSNILNPFSEFDSSQIDDNFKFDKSDPHLIK